MQVFNYINIFVFQNIILIEMVFESVIKWEVKFLMSLLLMFIWMRKKVLMLEQWKKNGGSIGRRRRFILLTGRARKRFSLLTLRRRLFLEECISGMRFRIR